MVCAGIGHQPRAGLDLVHAGADQALDLLGGLGAALRQVAHLAGHHGKAAALLAGTRGFHRGVQRQDVGLEGDAVDHADDVGDLLASCALISSMVATTWATTSPPRCGHLGAAAASWLAWRADVGALAHGAGELLHATRRSAAGCWPSARCARDRSWLPVAISRAGGGDAVGAAGAPRHQRVQRGRCMPLELRHQAARLVRGRSSVPVRSPSAMCRRRLARLRGSPPISRCRPSAPAGRQRAGHEHCERGQGHGQQRDAVGARAGRAWWAVCGHLGARWRSLRAAWPADGARPASRRC